MLYLLQRKVFFFVIYRLQFIFTHIIFYANIICIFLLYKKNYMCNKRKCMYNESCITAIKNRRH